MGKRGKRNRWKQTGSTFSRSITDQDQESLTTVSNSLVATYRNSEQDCSNDSHNDDDDDEDKVKDTFEVPTPYTLTDLNELSLLKPIQKAWIVLENRGKHISKEKRTASHLKTAGSIWIPTPIQLQTWSILLQSNKDLIGIAPTGSGKTLAYGLPLLSQIHTHVNETPLGSSIYGMVGGILGIVLVPTRELALQVEKDLNRAKFQNVSIKSIYGGVDRDVQLQLLNSSLSHNDNKNEGKEDAQAQRLVVTATPGRLRDLLIDLQSNSENGKDKCNVLSSLQWVVMDEGDRLATQVDLSKQVDDIIEIIGKVRKPRVCLFSATFPESAFKWNYWIHGKHVVVKVNTMTVGRADSNLASVGDESVRETSMDSAKGPVINNNEHTLNDHDRNDEPPKKKHKGPMDLARIPSNVTQTLHVCATHKKPKKLVTTLHKCQPDKANRARSLCLVFFARIKTLQYIFKLLQREGFACAELHSQLSQKEREQVLLHFQCGKVPILLATDVAARGIHVPNVDTVINYDFPASLEQYVHRCGRAGRSGNKPATVFSFFTRELQPMARDVWTLLKETNAWIDPNLAELLETKPSTRIRDKQSMAEVASAKSMERMDMIEVADHSEEDPYSFLNPNRIVLKRASHVSDASTDSEPDEES